MNVRKLIEILSKLLPEKEVYRVSGDEDLGLSKVKSIELSGSKIIVK